MTVTFFGHRDTPQSVKERLRKQICELIEKENADVFYVGNHGNFDRMTYSILKELKAFYPFISYTVVLAYLSESREKEFEARETVFPESVSCGPPRFAIDRRNRYMLEQCDAVISYVVHSYGGAARWRDRARRKGKRIFEISE